jgi:hypothetical protein
MPKGLCDLEWQYLPPSSIRILSKAGIFKKSMGTRNRVGIGLSYRPARDGFLNSLWGLGTGEEYGYRTGPPGYIGWRN